MHEMDVSDRVDGGGHFLGTMSCLGKEATTVCMLGAVDLLAFSGCFGPLFVCVCRTDMCTAGMMISGWWWSFFYAGTRPFFIFGLTVCHIVDASNLT